jgi:hypothetical protein
MSPIVTNVGVLVFAALGAAALAGDREGSKPESRYSLLYMELQDGTELNVRVPNSDAKVTDPLEVRITLSRSRKDLTPIWVVEKATSVRLTPQYHSHFYALVKVMPDRLFVFFTWNGHYCTIDRKTGTIVSEGDDEEILKDYDQFVPLKLSFASKLPPRKGEK